MSNAAAFEGSAAWNFNSQKQNEIGTPNTPDRFSNKHMWVDPQLRIIWTQTIRYILDTACYNLICITKVGQN